MENGNDGECFNGDKTSPSLPIESHGVNSHDVLEISHVKNEVNAIAHSCRTNDINGALNIDESEINTQNGHEGVPDVDQGPDELEESEEDSDDEGESWKNLPAASIFRIDFKRLQTVAEEIENQSSSDSDSSDEAENESTDAESFSVDEVGVSDSHDIRDMNMDLTPTRQTIKKLADVLWNDYNCYYREYEDKEYFVCARLYTGKNRVLSYFQLRHSETQHYDTIIFLPVLNEQKELQAIYAATSGHSSWRHIQLLCDQAFSTEISPKILHSDGAICHNVSCVVGMCRSKKSTFKHTVNLSNLELGEVCKNFTASVDKSNMDEEGVTRKDFLFPDFLKRKDIKSNVGEFYIKFNVELTISQLFHLVEKLELIYVDPTEKYCIKDSKLQRIVLKVSEEVAKVLQKELINNISSFVNSRLNIADPTGQHFCIEDMDFSELGDFDVSFKRERLFAEATTFKVKYVTSRLVELEDNPSFVEVLRAAIKLHQAESAKEQEPFDFDKIELSFAASTPRYRTRAKFQDYLRGHIYSNKMGKNYWLVSGDWYFVHKEYLLGVQEEFQDILKFHLVSKQNPDERKPPKLFLPWDLKSNKITHEDEYNKKYSKLENFYVGDKVLVSNIEYFDIAYEECTKNRTYLYHVKKGFGQTTRDVCSQLKNSAELLTSVRKTNKGNQNEISKIVSVLKTKLKIEEDKCRSLVGIGYPDRELVFVLGLLPSKNPPTVLKKPPEFFKWEDRIKSRTLQLEKDLATILNEDRIRDFIRKNEQFMQLLISESEPSCDIVESLIQKLEEKKFFRRKGDELKVTAKLIFTKAKTDFEELFPERKKTVKEELSGHVMMMLADYITYFTSLGAKLEIIRCRDFLRTKLNDVNACFKIDEIFAQVVPDDIEETDGNVQEKVTKTKNSKNQRVPNERSQKSLRTPKKQNIPVNIQEANTEPIEGLPDTQLQEDGPSGSINEGGHQITRKEITNETETASSSKKNSQPKKRKSKEPNQSAAKRKK